MCDGDVCSDSFVGCVESCTQVTNCVGAIAAVFASPLAFPCIFCFSSERDDLEGNEWDVSMLSAPCKQPCMCCFAMTMPWCAQCYLRRVVLDGDMSKYKCCQGYADGPYCCAYWSPSYPFTFEAGTYGEQTCPHLCLCAEVSCCCIQAFESSRMYMRDERWLLMDPTEVRMDNCLDCCGSIADMCACGACCVCCCGCIGKSFCGCQEEGDALLNLSDSMTRLARSIYQGMMYVIYIGMCCMSAQMCNESYKPIPGNAGAPQKRLGWVPPLERRQRESVQEAPTQQQMGQQPFPQPQPYGHQPFPQQQPSGGFPAQPYPEQGPYYQQQPYG